MSANFLSATLNELMYLHGLRPTELARKVNIPQSTIQRIAVGVSSNPHQSTLEALANYFSITVEQLKGLAPITKQKNSIVGITDVNFHQVPLIDWNSVTDWLVPHSDSATKELTKSIVHINTKVSTRSFALTVQDTSMEPLFSPGTTLIIDPDRSPKDGSYLIAKLHQYPEVIFRQLLINAPHRYLKPLSPDLKQFEIYKLSEQDEIMGVLVQANRGFAD